MGPFVVLNITDRPRPGSAWVVVNKTVNERLSINTDIIPALGCHKKVCAY